MGNRTRTVYQHGADKEQAEQNQPAHNKPHQGPNTLNDSGFSEL